ncbi:hypothetical protein FIBSPDRAFT_807094 [Athelia psychrophila]|uniref:P-loop containing nucleoside triphosphate hydrolase protein n=1 Tax=Athelia psychrophila TaxID=1759441 RepID=A0A167UQW7_9AGAM|nr:hypothetical protein FIBSPDRAFT_807094 [Fibularhizoctonia sp. CBS 109695]
MEDLERQRQGLKAEMTENRTKISEYKQTITEMNNSLRVINESIQGFETKIADETLRLEVNTQAKREETQRKLQDATNKVDQATAHLKALEVETAATEGQLNAVLADGRTAEEDFNKIKSEIQHHELMIKQCRQQEHNVYQPYGTNMQGVVDSIGKMQWHGTPPVGPFGLYVKVRDPERWAKLIRAQIGSAMSSFAITDSRDHAQLKRLLQNSGNKNQIIIAERDEFDYSSGEPSDPNILTVLRALDISHAYVLRLLINQFQIERTILAATRGDADHLLQGFSSGGVAWSADGMRVQRFPEGGLSSTKLTPINNSSDPRNLLFTGKDAAGQLREWKDALGRVTPTLQDAKNKCQRVKQEASRLGNVANSLKNQSKIAFREVNMAEQAKTTLQGEANKELPVSLSALEDAKAEMVVDKDFLKQQFTDVSIKKGEVDETQKPLQEQINEIKKQMDEFKQRADDAQAKVTTAVVARKKAQSDIKYYTDKLGQEQAVHVDLETKCATVTAEFEDWTAKALQFCPEIPNPRKSDVLQRDLNATKNALKERERRHGASVEEMTVEVNKAKANLDSAEKELKNMWSLNKALGSSLSLRRARWQEFCRHISLRCKLVFQCHLSNRGYYGKVLFNHEAGTLQLKVQTDEQAQTQGARDKDPRSLSGGEKSFSTICLLLSLWESIGCPLRCLDEFDVFMDAVNRRISMKMMIDTANASDKKQYILITPLAVNMEIGPSVRVHRMSDPERGQATLAFN